MCHDKGGLSEFVKHLDIKYDIGRDYLIEGKRRKRQMGK